LAKDFYIQIVDTPGVLIKCKVRISYYGKCHLWIGL